MSIIPQIDLLQQPEPSPALIAATIAALARAKQSRAEPASQPSRPMPSRAEAEAMIARLEAERAAQATFDQTPPQQPVFQEQPEPALFQQLAPFHPQPAEQPPALQPAFQRQQEQPPFQPEPPPQPAFTPMAEPEPQPQQPRRRRVRAIDSILGARSDEPWIWLPRWAVAATMQSGSRACRSLVPALLLAQCYYYFRTDAASIIDARGIAKNPDRPNPIEVRGWHPASDSIHIGRARTRRDVPVGISESSGETIYEPTYGEKTTWNQIAAAMEITARQARDAAIWLRARGWIRWTPDHDDHCCGIFIVPGQAMEYYVEQPAHELTQDEGRGVKILHRMRRVVGDDVAALLLSQHMWWHVTVLEQRPGHERYCSDEQFASELGLTRDQVRRARELLTSAGLLATRTAWAGRRGNRSRVVHYRLLVEELVARWIAARLE